jgi:hypothetical protein
VNLGFRHSVLFYGPNPLDISSAPHKSMPFLPQPFLDTAGYRLRAQDGTSVLLKEF